MTTDQTTIKALPAFVYSNKHLRCCANGGISESADKIYVVCDDGFVDIAQDDPRLMRLEANVLGHIKLVPVNPQAPDDHVGPMFGGSYASSSDARFDRLIRKTCAHNFYGAVPIHDRYESPELNRALSR